VKVVSGEQTGSLNYPPPGTYTFHYSLTSGRGDWKSSRVWQTGQNFNNPLIPVEVVDEISKKTLPPTNSFLSLGGENLVLSTVKKSDLENAVLVRAYEIAGGAAETPIHFLGRDRAYAEVNLLEEDTGESAQVLKIKPYEIRTVKLR
jgi:alpha-mannosidase